VGSSPVHRDERGAGLTAEFIDALALLIPTYQVAPSSWLF
jgi:hypothetical protein